MSSNKFNLLLGRFARCQAARISLIPETILEFKSFGPDSSRLVRGVSRNALPRHCDVVQNNIALIEVQLYGSPPGGLAPGLFDSDPSSHVDFGEPEFQTLSNHAWSLLGGHMPTTNLPVAPERAPQDRQVGVSILSTRALFYLDHDMGESDILVRPSLSLRLWSNEFRARFIKVVPVACEQQVLCRTTILLYV